MVSTYPKTTQVTGSDILALGQQLAQILAQVQQAAQGQAGYFDPSTFGPGGIAGFLPTLARQQYEAGKADADRQYSLDVQRYGLSVAQFNYNQRLGEEQQKTQRLQLLSGLQGPGDWVRYNHVINNLAPPAGKSNPGAANPQISQPYGGPAPTSGTAGAAAPAPNTAPPAPPPGVNLAGLSADQLKQGAGIPAISGQVADPGAAATALSTSLQAGGFMGAPGSAPPPPPQQQAGGLDQGLLAQIRASSPAGSLGSIPFAAEGGTAEGAAIVGDSKNGKPNPEIVIHLGGGRFGIVPLSKMGVDLDQLKGLPHAASGGFLDFNTYDPASFGSMPFAQKEQGLLGAPAFGARGEDLGGFGKGPMSFQRYQQLLPSEQDMLQGYVNTPGDQGGLGGWFADEYARAQRSAVTGSGFRPAEYGQ